MFFASFLSRAFVRKDAHFRRMFVSVTFWQFLFLRTAPTQVTMSKGLLHCSSKYSIYKYIYVAPIILHCCKHEISTIRKVQPSHQITVISHKFFRNITKSTPWEKEQFKVLPISHHTAAQLFMPLVDRLDTFPFLVHVALLFISQDQSQPECHSLQGLGCDAGAHLLLADTGCC